MSSYLQTFESLSPRNKKLITNGHTYSQNASLSIYLTLCKVTKVLVLAEQLHSLLGEGDFLSHCQQFLLLGQKQIQSGSCTNSKKKPEIV